MDTLVREARMSDADGVARVEVEAWRDTYPTLLPNDYLVQHLDVGRGAATWRRRLRGRSRNTLVAAPVDTPKKISGYATWGRCRLNVPTAGGGELYELYLMPGHQERGLGRRLCAAVARRLVDCGLSSMRVEVLEGNPARFFYEALGARLAARTRHPFAGEVLPAFIYIWNDLPRLASETTG